MKPDEPLRLPTALLALEFVGSVLTGLGVAGAFGALDGLIDAFEDRRIAWFTAAFGAVLLAASLPGLLRWARENAERRK
ncbi:MAG: hypothetical protein RML56_13615 [Burkholderiales bacterium]|nr:hypothetical protein [Burkholderiales bacterium]